MAASQHPRPSPEGYGAGVFQTTFSTLVTAALPEAVRTVGTPIEIWHQDEARIVQQATLTYIWADKGSRPAAPKDLRYEWAYLFGAVCAERGVGAGLVLPYANAEMMNLQLAEISQRVAAGAHRVLVVDGAGWHQSAGRLRVLDNLSLLHLPPYSPELNPAENVWQYLRQNHLSNRVFASYDAVVDACCDAWMTLMNTPEHIRSIAIRSWTHVT